MSISTNAISNDTRNPNSITSRWGVTAYEYTFDDAQMDFQDLMVEISKHRATAIEGEVQPLATRINNRNKELESWGNILAQLTELQASYPDDDKNKDTKDIPQGNLTTEEWDMLHDLTNADPRDNKYFRSECEGAVQAVKSKIDQLNNAAQMDISRLQTLVDRRDESFSTATSLMTEVSETRDNTIRNM